MMAMIYRCQNTVERIAAYWADSAHDRCSLLKVPTMDTGESELDHVAMEEDGLVC